MYMMSYLSIAEELFYDTAIDVYNIVLKTHRICSRGQTTRELFGNGWEAAASY